MTPGSSGHLRRACALALGALAILLGLGLSAAPAHAETPAVTLDLVSLTVTGNRPSDEVVLRVKATNTGDLPAYGVQRRAVAFPRPDS